MPRRPSLRTKNRALLLQTPLLSYNSQTRFSPGALCTLCKRLLMVHFNSMSTLRVLARNRNSRVRIPNVWDRAANQFLAAAAVDRGIEALSASYNQRFDEVFPIPTEYTTSDRHALREFSKAITSNLVGGIGYFYGKSIVDKSFSYEWDQEDSGSTPDEEDEEQKGAHLTEPRSLLTATPSRSFFPRGFYW